MAFELYLTQDKAKPKQWLRLTCTLSLAVHGVLLAAGAAYSFWHVDELSPPTVAVTFMYAAPSPPPPPPKRKKPQVKPKPATEVVQPKPDRIVQPQEAPKEEPPQDEDEDEGEGEEGGVEGGVSGGVVGGVIGDAPAPPPEPPKFLPPAVGHGHLAINPQDDRYRVHLPPAMKSAGMTFWAMVKLCVSADGNVTDVKILKGADPALDTLIKQKLGTWRYEPYTINGRPIPFCTNVRYEIGVK